MKVLGRFQCGVFVLRELEAFKCLVLILQNILITWWKDFRSVRACCKSFFVDLDQGWVGMRCIRGRIKRFNRGCVEMIVYAYIDFFRVGWVLLVIVWLGLVG